MHRLRSVLLLTRDETPLSGGIQVDGGYFAGKYRKSNVRGKRRVSSDYVLSKYGKEKKTKVRIPHDKRNFARKLANQHVVLVMREVNNGYKKGAGRTIVSLVKRECAKEVIPLIHRFVKWGSHIASDESHAYNELSKHYTHVMVRAYSTFSGVSLVGSYTDAPPPPPPGAGGSATVTDISASRRNWQRYTLDLPAGMSSLVVSISGGSGDADLYVREGAQSTTRNYDCRPYKSGNNETCTFNNPDAGTWHIDIRAYSSFSGVTLQADWE